MKKEVDPKAVSARLIRRMKDLDISGADITRATGASSAAITKWRQGINAPTRYALQLSELLQCTPEWLLYGDGAPKETPGVKSPIVQDFSRAGTLLPYDDINEIPKTETNKRGEIVYVNFVPNLSMANGSGVSNEDSGEYIKFPFYMNSLRKAGVQDPDKVIVGYADGESNAPSIPDHAVIGIDTNCTRIYNEEIYLINVEGKERLKQILNLGEGRYMIRSLNEDKELFPDEIYDAEKMMETQFLVIGRMFWCSWLKRLKH